MDSKFLKSSIDLLNAQKSNNLNIGIDKSHLDKPASTTTTSGETPAEKEARLLKEKAKQQAVTPTLYNKIPSEKNTKEVDKKEGESETYTDEYGELKYKDTSKKVAPIKGVNEGFYEGRTYKGKVSKEDIELREKLVPLIKEKIEYLKSPEYKRRLLAMNNIKDPDKFIKDRIDVIKNITLAKGQEGDASYTDFNNFENSTFINIADNKKTTAAHEIGHATSSPSELMKSVGQATPRKMSAAEGWLFLNRQKDLTPDNKKFIQQVIAQKNKAGQYPNDPGAVLAELKDYDVHEIGASEAKGDLEAMRYLLRENGYTKKYGQDLDLETIKKAFNDKKLQNDDYIKRLRRRFTDEAIVELNNRVAKTDKKSNEDIA